MLEGEVWYDLTAITRMSISDQAGVWKFRCVCGNEHVARAKDVRSGNTKSCGHRRSWREAAQKGARMSRADQLLRRF